jgi:hypothetical protein
MSQDFKATIRQDSVRAQAWREVFGSYEIPLQSPIPTQASAPGIESGFFYLLDLTSLTSEQRARLIAYIAKKFAVDEQEVAETLDTVGCPILDEDVTITVFNPLRWL